MGELAILGFILECIFVILLGFCPVLWLRAGSVMRGMRRGLINTSVIIILVLYNYHDDKMNENVFK